MAQPPGLVQDEDDLQAANGDQVGGGAFQGGFGNVVGADDVRFGFGLVGEIVRAERTTQVALWTNSKSIRGFRCVGCRFRVRSKSDADAGVGTGKT